LPGIHIEVKRTESLRLYDALAQSRHDAAVGDHGIPIVAHRRNEEDWVVIMAADDWFTLYKAWEENPTATDIASTVRDDHVEFKCSRCGATIGCVECGSLDGAKFNFCPGCGAKLEGYKWWLEELRDEWEDQE
jgi:DNA-directed RNA polymerase subunit RPC12/RpoP